MMVSKSQLLTLVILVACFTLQVSATSIGAVPSSIQLGQVQPGEAIEQPIYVTVRSPVSQENFTIDPTATAIGAESMFNNPRIEEKQEISEQSASQWWSFETAVAGPRITIDEPRIDSRGLPELNGVSTGRLTIPDDAEPGYRYGHILLNPDTPQAAEGAGQVGFVSPTRVSYSFFVSGDPERDLTVQDIRGIRTGSNRASIEVLLTNEGTVTASTDEFEIDIQRRDTTVDTLTVSRVTLEPGESQWTNAYWRGPQVESGEYYLDGRVDYFTGNAYASGSFSLGDIVTVEEAPDDSPINSSQDSREEVPIWLVFMVLAILTVLMWSFDIEPFWILAIIGGLAIASFILLSGVSNYLLVVLLMAVGIVVYGVM